MCLLALIAILLAPIAAAAGQPARPLPSLQAASGLWDMPTARVLPDWNLRLKYGKAEPFRYYGVALGLFDRLEINGQFTEISSRIAFAGYGYGYYKDRNAGARLVLVRERPWLPQVAVGAHDPIGTGLFPARYLVASKLLGPLDLTVGLGQGILAGQSYLDIRNEGPSTKHAEAFDTTFLFSSPSRRTRPFGGLEYHLTDDLTLTAEYSSLKYEKQFGTPRPASSPINIGLKFGPWHHLVVQGGYMRGQEVALGLSAEMPLNPEGLLAWKKEAPYTATEAQRWQAWEAKNDELAALVGNELQQDGFSGVAVAVRDRAVWIEAENRKYLSPARALGRLAEIVEALCPQRIVTVYLNLTRHGQTLQSLKANRNDLLAFRRQRMDKKGFLAFADLSQYNTEHYNEFFLRPDGAKLIRPARKKISFTLVPRIKTFLNNRTGFFKHKVLLQPRLSLFPWRNATLTGEMEFTLYNEWDEVIFSPLEPEPARTDLMEYERSSRPRLSLLDFTQTWPLPGNVLGRVSAGFFESTYGGVAGELFRFFREGRYGVGLETEQLRKRDIDNNFRLSNEISRTFSTCFVNLYGQLWPEQGLEAGLKIGRFLAADTGFRLELRRSFKYFTVGAWYTNTDGGRLTSPKNVGNREKGVYIRIPLSLFTDHDIRGSLLYTFASFTRDPGQTVRQLNSLYPMTPYGSVDHVKRTLEDMGKN